jgi:putative oxidoreductase
VQNGGDAAILFCFVFLYLFVAGPGSWSLDEATRRSRDGRMPMTGLDTGRNRP